MQRKSQHGSEMKRNIAFHLQVLLRLALHACQDQARLCARQLTHAPVATLHSCIVHESADAGIAATSIADSQAIRRSAERAFLELGLRDVACFEGWAIIDSTAAFRDLLTGFLQQELDESAVDTTPFLEMPGMDSAEFYARTAGACTTVRTFQA